MTDPVGGGWDKCLSSPTCVWGAWQAPLLAISLYQLMFQRWVEGKSVLRLLNGLDCSEMWSVVLCQWWEIVTWVVHVYMSVSTDLGAVMVSLFFASVEEVLEVLCWLRWSGYLVCCMPLGMLSVAWASATELAWSCNICSRIVPHASHFPENRDGTLWSSLEFPKNTSHTAGATDWPVPSPGSNISGPVGIAAHPQVWLLDTPPSIAACLGWSEHPTSGHTLSPGFRMFWAVLWRRSYTR